MKTSKAIISLIFLIALTIILPGCKLWRVKENKIVPIIGVTEEVQQEKISQVNKPPYEATWFVLDINENGDTIVPSYPYGINGSLRPIVIFTIENNVLTHIVFTDGDLNLALPESIEEVDAGKYRFNIGNNYEFEWDNKEKHIARWYCFFGESKREPVSDLYVDSLYNKYQFVTIEWDQNLPLE